MALIGLGVAIDHALLVVTRWREKRQKPGADGPGSAARREAVVRSVASAGRVAPADWERGGQRVVDVWTESWPSPRRPPSPSPM
ncbi:hypothetical protein ACFYYB_23340 [Streptomyces sp. NPDC002886]|uniref:hypothetical protein n=1 Tax=Streptomyces sp. NPDC002886 TaxID=3364667 RepID=UPI0036758405